MTVRADIKSRLDFATSEAWQAYVKENVEPQERGYIWALGVATLYLRFYETQHRAVPSKFTEELDRIKDSLDPERTHALNALNSKILAHVTLFLKDSVPKDTGEVIVERPRAVVEKLLTYIGEKNDAFSMWAMYKRLPGNAKPMPTWEQYVHGLQLGDDNTTATFALLMGQLGELLFQYRDQNLPLPHLVFQRVWFLHHEREGEERNFHARSIVHELLEAMTPCTFA